MAKPTDSFEWATDTNQSTGPDAGTPTKAEPASGFKIQGWISEAPYLGQYMNWLFYVIGQWTEYWNKLEAAGMRATTAAALSLTTAATYYKIVNWGVSMPATIPANTALDVPSPGAGSIEVQDVGTYEVHVYLRISAASASETFTFQIFVNGVGTGIIATVPSDGSDTAWDPSFSGIIEVTGALHEVEVRVLATGSSKSITTTTGSTFWMRRID